MKGLTTHIATDKDSSPRNCTGEIRHPHHMCNLAEIQENPAIHGDARPLVNPSPLLSVIIFIIFGFLIAETRSGY